MIEHFKVLACNCPKHKVLNLHGIKVAIGCQEDGTVSDANVREQINGNPVLKSVFNKSELVDSNES